MNVNDVITEDPGMDKLKWIFETQEALGEEYIEIEKKSGLGYGIVEGSFNIDHKSSQYFCKDLAWRVVEEIGECLECFNDETHRKEEFIDAIHFMIELLIVNGIKYEDLVEELELGYEDSLKALYEKPSALDPLEEFIMLLGTTMNFLKNKPWKRTQILTDVKRYKKQLINSFEALIDLGVSFGVTADDLYDFYYRKSAVNKFRIRSRY